MVTIHLPLRISMTIYPFSTDFSTSYEKKQKRSAEDENTLFYHGDGENFSIPITHDLPIHMT